jgi:hypothetical protein
MQATITGDGFGNVWVSWSNYDGLFARRWDGSEWSEIVVIDSGGAFPYASPEMDRGPGGEPWIVWNGKTLMKTAVYGGGDWRLVPTAFDTGQRPEITGNPLCIGWMESSGGGNLFASLYYWGGGWGSPDTITYIPQCYCRKAHAMAADSAGNIWVIWKPHEDRLYAKSSRDGWQERITAVPDGVWGFHTVTVDGIGRIWVGFIVGSSVYASCYDGMEWSEAVLVCSTTVRAYELSSTTDEFGTVWISWDAGHMSRDVFASCYKQSRWITSPVDTCLSNDWNVSIASDVNGNVWVAWSSDRDGDHNIYVSHTEAVGVRETSESASPERRLWVYPNPVTGVASVRYPLLQANVVHIAVYNLLGQEVRTLTDSEQSAGLHTVVWDGRDNSGRRVSSGPYFLRLEAGDYSATKKVCVVR